MKDVLEKAINQALMVLLQENSADISLPSIQITRTKDKQHGDFACNVALLLAKPLKQKPRNIAEKLVACLPANPVIEKVDIAGPGFINFYLTNSALVDVIKTILSEKEQFGHSQIGQQEKVLVEFVSANPTGALHVGHGRGACYGAAVSDLLATQGFDVHREYYVNDAGRQMDILAVSVWLRYLALNSAQFDFPSNGYKGDYIIDIAKKLQAMENTALIKPLEEVFEAVPADEKAGEGDKEAHINALIHNAKMLLGDGFNAVHQLALTEILDDIKEDLSSFGIEMQVYFSEKGLVESGDLAKGIEHLKGKGLLYEKEGAWWFKATDYGDEKDRVVVRANGQHTYFATDLVYHVNKFERGFKRIIDIFGADHHGYVARIKAGVQAAGYSAEAFTVLLVQFATLYRGKERVQMSTRSGSFVTVRALREDVGKDAARFFYTMRKADQHMDFDLALAKSKSNENPVYYIQYAHARICSVLRQMVEKGFAYDEAQGLANLATLTSEHEQKLTSTLAAYPELLQKSALNYEPHSLANYLRTLANDLHVYYNAQQVLVDDASVRQARISLLSAVKQVIANGLSLLGVSTPEKM